MVSLLYHHQRGIHWKTIKEYFLGDSKPQGVTKQHFLLLLPLWQGKARQGKARRGEARRGEARRGEARRGKARQGKARH